MLPFNWNTTEKVSWAIKEQHISTGFVYHEMPQGLIDVYNESFKYRDSYDWNARMPDHPNSHTPAHAKSWHTMTYDPCILIWLFQR